MCYSAIGPNSNFRGDETPNACDLSKLLAVLAQQGSLYIVIDALDEYCSTTRRVYQA